MGFSYCFLQLIYSNILSQLFFYISIAFPDIPNLEGTFVMTFFFTSNLTQKIFYFVQRRYLFNFCRLFPYFPLNFFCIILKGHILTIELVPHLKSSSFFCFYVNLLFECFIYCWYIFLVL